MGSYGSYNQDYDRHWQWLDQGDTLKEQLKFNEKYASELKDLEKYWGHLKRKKEGTQEAHLAKDVAAMALTLGAAGAAGGASFGMKAAGDAMMGGSPLTPAINWAIDSAMEGLFKTRELLAGQEFMNMHPSDFARVRRKAFATQEEFEAFKKGEISKNQVALLDYIAPVDKHGNVSTMIADAANFAKKGPGNQGWDFFSLVESTVD